MNLKNSIENKTFKEWKELGYRINKGAKFTMRNLAGVPLFTPKQVTLHEWPIDDGYSDDPLEDYCRGLAWGNDG